MHAPRPPRSNSRRTVMRVLALAVCSVASAPAAPVITQDPQPRTVAFGNNAALTVAATAASPSYQWFRGASGDTASPVSGATGPLLVTPPIRVSASFWVRVSDATGSADSQAATVSPGTLPPVRLLGCGYNSNGQLGDGTTTARSVLAPVANDAAEAFGGVGRSFFLKSGNSLWGTGANYYGQLGNGTTTGTNLPVSIAGAVRQVASGSHFTLLVKKDGTAWATGDNPYGQFGNGTTIGCSSPIPVSQDVAMAAAGAYHSLLLKTNGALFASGSNSFGQLGDSTTTDSPNWVQIATEVQSVSAGENHTVFVKSDGTAWGMGKNYQGQVGGTSPTLRTTPSLIASDVAAVSAGDDFTWLLKTNGELWGVGYNSSGQLGDGTTTTRYQPLKIADAVIAASCGSQHGIFLKSDSSLWATGYNYYGQLGDGTTTNRTTPALITTGMVSVSAGDFHSLTIQGFPFFSLQPADAEIALGGTTTLVSSATGAEPPAFQWYHGTSGDTSHPIAGATSPELPTPAASADAFYWVRATNRYGSADSRTVLVRAFGPPSIPAAPEVSLRVQGAPDMLTVSATGGTLTYQWYEGSSGDTTRPVGGATSKWLITPPGQTGKTFWARVGNVAGSTDSQGVAVPAGPTVSGRLTVCGYNISGQLGDGGDTARTTPIPLAPSVIHFAAASDHSVFVKSDGSVWTCGENSYGELGDGSIRTRYYPLQIASGAVSCAAGRDHSLFLDATGGLWATGNNAYGQLFDGTTTSRVVPTPAASNISRVACGDSHTLVIKSDGSLWAAGWNYYGQLGDGTTTDRKTPVQVASEVAFVAAGENVSFFIKDDGSLWAMGENTKGQLGDGTKTNRAAPARIADGVAGVSCHYTHTLFVKNDGSMWATGYNNYGQLGNGGTTDVSTPIRIMDGVRMVSAGDGFSRFIKTDGTLWAVGKNSYGTIGNGTDQTVFAPVQVGTDALTVASSKHAMTLDLQPTLLAHPADTGAMAGETARLSVEAVGCAPISYQWYRGESGDTATPVSGAVSSELEISPVTASDRFWVRVTTPYGTLDSASALVTPVTIPVVTQPPADSTLPAGANGHLAVSATGGILSYQWYLGVSGNTEQPIAGADGPLLVTPPLSATSAYWVRVTNAAGHADAAATLTIIPPDPKTLWTRGSAEFGQLGNGSSAVNFFPAPIASGVSKVSSAGGHTLFLKTDGTLWATGLNTSGQLGDGTTTSRTSPVQIAAGVAQIAAAPTYSTYLKSDGSLYGVGSYMGTTHKLLDSSVSMMWTGNSAVFWRKTNGTLWSRLISSPSSSQLATGVTSAAAGYYHLLYMTTDGSLWGYGDNSEGQITGDGSSNGSYATPTQVAKSVLRVAASGNGSAFIRSDGTAWGMGDNTYQQVLDPNTLGITSWSRTLSAITSGAAEVFSGPRNILVLKQDGSLWGTGSGLHGQLGESVPNTSAVPALLASRVITASAGLASTLFVTTDGTLWGMGSNTTGQLGDTATASGAIQQPVIDRVVSIAAGESHTLIVRDDGSLWTCGLNHHGQLGDGTRLPSNIPVRVAESVKCVAAGEAHSLFVKTDGTLWAMGYNASGQLGNGTTVDKSQPIQVASGVVSVKAGRWFSLYLKTDGSLWATGDNNEGQFGIGTTSTSHIPIQIASGIATYGAGTTHTWYVKANGDLWTMGSNAYGKLGDGSFDSRFLPEKVATRVIGGAAGAHHTAFVRDDGTLWTVGGNTNGQLGDGSGNDRNIPQQVATGIADVSATGTNTLILSDAGALSGCGSNTSKQLADGTTPSYSTPVPIATGVNGITAGGACSLWLSDSGGIRPTGIIRQPGSVATGGGATTTLEVAAIGAGDLSYQWYRGLSGDTSQPVANATGTTLTLETPVQSDTFWVRVTGTGGSADSRSARITVESPPQIASQPTATESPEGGMLLEIVGSANTDTVQWFEGWPGDISKPVPGGSQATLLTRPIRSSTRFWARLSNAAGSVDSNGIGAEPPPVRGYSLVAAGKTFGGKPVTLAGAVANASLGTNHGMFVGTNGVLWAVGSNTYGQFGNGTTTGTTTTPARVMDGVESVSAGDQHSLIVKSDHTLWACGRNSSGQLGDGTTTNRSLPVWIASNVAAAAAGGSHSHFITTDGRLFSMGSNSYRQLGDSTGVRRLYPVQVADGVAAVAAGQNHSLFLGADGNLRSTGNNTYGQLGNGNRNGLPVPSPALIAEGVIAVSASDRTSLFVRGDGASYGTGMNLYGELGFPPALGTFYSSGTATRLAPTITGGNARVLAAGYLHSLRIDATGTAWASGSNSYGQFGTGTTTNSLAPTVSITNVSWAEAGGYDSFFLKKNSSGTSPGITVHPISQTILDGQPVSLSASASGSPTLVYQWFSGDSGDTSQPVAGATSSAFTPPVPVSSARYWVRVSNSAAQAYSRTATLNNVPMPEDYREWAASSGLTGTAVDPSADPDADGCPNLLEFAFRTHPGNPASSGHPELSVSRSPGGQNTLSLIHRRATGTSLRWIYQKSTGLDSWTDVMPTVTVIDPDPDGDGTCELVSASLPASGDSKVFMRIRVSGAVDGP